ncbi:tryptophan aminotransferase-related protein 3-like [Dioscorea cayenensis subsp. rotundata]|uniref:Tryptophan aminotransferase-related protein 3-like n=1 Tax=Dioscorea cayennensis subsp. rotundata TaxID=55577 RepID=A0AB40ARB9_DIOCR|nr:tryptophan aminotransferase-related protein 3-like [Dioscorea cayenensis subsp. rotundata]
MGARAGGRGLELRLGSINLLLLIFFITSLFFNVYFFFFFFSYSSIFSLWPEPRWSQSAAEEAEAVAAISCSGHGRAFVDGIMINGRPSCECNTCYHGSDCSIPSLDCSADADSGNPLFLEPYWYRHAKGSAVVVAGWHRMGYDATGENFISVELEQHIRKLHRIVGNAVVDDRFIIFGAGSTQLLYALVHALSPHNSSSPASVVASIPYYPVYKMQVDLFNSKLAEWRGVTSSWVNESISSSSSSSSDGSMNNFIEFVTSPNNPDGLLKQSILGGSSVIYDYAYYWPHFTAIPAPSDHNVMIFSSSKLSGHASSRFGWALIKDEQVYKKAIYYMKLNTMGVSRDTQLRMLKIIKVILAEHGRKGDIFSFGYQTMRERWTKLNKVVSKSKRFSLQTIPSQYCNYFKTIRDPSPAYAWLKCERDEDQECDVVLKNAGIICREGSLFEADDRYVRLSLVKTQDDFDQLVQKMDALVSDHSSISSI